MIEDSEARAIEAGEPLIGAKPQIPVGGLSGGDHGVLRQPVLAAPGLVVVLREAAARLERQARGAQPQDEGAPEPEEPSCRVPPLSPCPHEAPSFQQTGASSQNPGGRPSASQALLAGVYALLP